MAETLKSFGEGVQRVMDHTKSIDHHMTHTAVSVGNIVKSLFGYALIQKSIESLMHNSTWGQRLALSLDTAKMSAVDLHKQQPGAQRSQRFQCHLPGAVQNGELSIAAGCP
jgi:hypothetical protein